MEGVDLEAHEWLTTLIKNFLISFSCYSDLRGTGPLKTTMDVIDAAKVAYNFASQSWLI